METQMSSVAARLLSGQAIALTSNILVGIAAARIWGADARGLVVAILAWPLGLVFFGEGGVQRSLPFILKTRREQAASVVTAGLIVWLSFSAILLTLWAVLLILGWVQSDPVVWLWLCGALLPLNLLFPFGKGLMLGLGRIRFLNTVLYRTGPIPLLVIVIAGLLLNQNNPEDAWWFIVAQLVGFALAAVHLFRCLWVEGVLKFRQVEWRTVRLVAVTIVTFGASSVMLNLMQMASPLILSLPVMDVPKAHLANFTVGVAVAGLIRQIPDAISKAVLFRGTSGADPSEDPHEYALATMVFARRGLLIVIAVGFPIALLAPVIVPLAYGPDFYLAGWVTASVMPGFVGFFVAKIYEASLSAQGKTRVLARSLTPAVIILVVSGCVMVPLFGLWGMILAVNLGYITASITISYMFCGLYKLPVRGVYLPSKRDFYVVWMRIGGLTSRLIMRLRRNG